MAPGPNLVATSDTPPRGDLAGRRRGRPGFPGRPITCHREFTLTEQRAFHKPVPLPPDVVADIGDPTADSTPAAELLERLEAALRLLPAAERKAVLEAHAEDDEDGGVARVAAALDISAEDAEALTRSAVQLLRGALADLEPEEAPPFASVARRSGERRPHGHS